MKTNIINRVLEAVRDMATIWGDEMKMTVKDEGVLIFFIIVPLLYPLLYAWIYNNEVVHEVPVAIVDQSHSHDSREFIRMCDASADVKVAYYCSSLDEAKELVGRQIVHGVLFFPANYASSIARGEQANVSVYCDMSLMLTYKAILQTTTNVSQRLGSKIQMQRKPGYTNRDDEVTTHPLDIEEVQIFNATGGYGNAVLPGVLIVIIQQTLLLGIGLAAGTSRERNRHASLVPISRHHNGLLRIVAGKALCYAMLYAVITAYLVLVVPKIFSFTTLAGGKELLGLLTPFVLSCIFFGMTVSCLIRYRENVILIVVFTSLILLFLTGISWPKSNIPAFWQGVSWIFPSTFGVKGFLTVSSMGGTLADCAAEIKALWIQTVVYFFLTCIVYDIQIRRSK